ncbi:Glucosamine-6-phosphate isomerase (Glucosamine-6-phosphate deaminase) (GNPDA) (GlcN6P deaminase) [Dispira simplex]|nr:Glucosamine-6-phosphate isomerase (Glucosamine-6-phosphate deaminase) (GNPDA) (GlcN6P deaminase) [Dispira simplex]
MRAFVGIFGWCALVLGASSTLWPIPQVAKLGDKVAIVGPELKIHYSCKHRVLDAAAKRYTDLISNTDYISPTKYNHTEQVPKDKVLTNVYVKVNDCGGNYPNFRVDESYQLNIGKPESDIKANVTAGTVWGVLRALETLSQLTYHTHGSKHPVIEGLPLYIEDRPAYPHRGLLLDTSRNYFPVEDIKRTLDAMSYNKLNVFHWHIVDSQSWPVETKFSPEVGQKGAYGLNMMYSHHDVKAIIYYGLLRGIRVIPEFEMPGHQGSVWHAIPEIVTCYNTQPHWDKVAAEPPSGQLNPIHPKTDEFVRNVITEYTALFPDPYFHTGNDEVNEKCWTDNASIREYMTTHNKTMNNLVSDFVTRAHGYLEKRGKKPMIWEEALLDFEVPLHNDTIVQVWRGASNTQKVVAKGYQVLANSYEYWYLDCGRGGWVGNNPKGNSWCDPFKTWQRMYSYDPVANLTSSGQRDLVVGGDVCLWTEQVDHMNLDQALWPRAAAAAEVLWSGKDKNGKMRSVKDALVRIQDQRFRMVSRGIGATPLQPLWCARNPGDCDLPPS